MLKTNRELLPMIAVQGQVDHPKVFDGSESTYDHTGRGQNVPRMGGITYNFNIGDPCMNLRGDHIEPGVTTINLRTPEEERAYLIYPCAGNSARVVTGDAKGDLGYVTGKHGNSHLMLYFAPATLEKLSYEDHFLVKSWGMGLQLMDYPEVSVFNLDPDLLDKINIREEAGRLLVPVVKRIPSHLMGSGIGWNTRGAPLIGQWGDYDIMTTDRDECRRFGLDDLRFGDFVLLEDQDNTFGRTRREGSVTIGLIVHSDSLLMGHGPGVMTLFSCRSRGILEGYPDSRANLADMLSLHGSRL